MKNLHISIPAALAGAIIAFACTVGSGKDTAAQAGNGSDDTAAPPSPQPEGYARSVLQVSVDFGFDDSGVLWQNLSDPDEDERFCGEVVALPEGLTHDYGWDYSGCCPEGFSPAGSPAGSYIQVWYTNENGEGREINVPAVINCLQN